MTIEPKLMSEGDLERHIAEAEVFPVGRSVQIRLLAHIAAQDQRIAELRAAVDVGAGLLESCAGRLGRLPEYTSSIADLRDVRDGVKP